jgi:NAD(P)-dependent dehydrogenase (short-subunit alcohol dehydrogenase family)
MESRVVNKVVIVTGASSGIGKAIALRFAQEGASVVVSSRSLPRCEEVTREIQDQGNKALAVSCDVRNEEEVAKLFQQARETFGEIDIVVANAGISGGSTLVENYKLEQWNAVLATNLTGVFLTVREAFRFMKTKGGHILVISSQAGLEGYAQKGVYCAVKFGVRGLAHALGEEGRRYNINVSAICPGTVDTPILAATNTVCKNPLSTDAVADAAVFLAGLRGNSLVRDVLLERMRLG